MHTKLRSSATDGAPAPVGPYSQAVSYRELVFCSGQLPVRPEGGSPPDGIALQTEQVFDNLEAVLRASTSRLDLVTKVTVYLCDLGDFEAMNAVYARRFGEHRPARTTVEVSRLALGAKLELDCIAVADSGDDVA